MTVPAPQRHDKTIALLPFQSFSIDFSRAAAAKDMINAGAAMAMALGPLARAEHLDAAKQRWKRRAAGQRIDIIQSDAVIRIRHFFGEPLQSRVGLGPAIMQRR